MKKHFSSLVSTTNRLWTISFLTASFVLIMVSLMMGMKNNPPMAIMFVCGIGFLYLALIHPWRKSISYIYLTVTTLAIFLLFFFITIIVSSINLGSEMTGPGKIHVIVGGIYSICLSICLPGMIIGLLGSLIHDYREHQVGVHEII